MRKNVIKFADRCTQYVTNYIGSKQKLVDWIRRGMAPDRSVIRLRTFFNAPVSFRN